MGRGPISQQEARLFQALQAATDWRTSNEFATVSGVAKRTARNHMKRFVGLGVARNLKLSPAYKYRATERLGTDAQHYVSALLERWPKLVTRRW